MEETEVEEGEAYCYKDDTSIDPDIDLSYIDAKIENVLGHFQKDFQTEVSVENLGAKFGGYGSFLPTYQRSPSIWSQPKSPHRFQNHSTSRTPNNLCTEGTLLNSTAPSDAPLTEAIGAAYSSLPALRTASVPYGDVKAKQGSSLSSGQVSEKFSLKCEPTSNKLVNSADQRPLKVRIKVGSDITARNKAAICSRLGLISPSSSAGSSPEERGGTTFETQETVSESPARIFQIMTSFPVPGGLLLSPLHENILCLIRRERLSSNGKPEPTFKDGGQEHSAMSVNDSASMLSVRTKSKEKKTSLKRMNKILIESNHGDGIGFDDNLTSFTENNSRHGIMESIQRFSRDMMHKPLSNSSCDASRVVKKSVLVKEKEAGSNEMADRIEESLYGQDSGKSEKQGDNNNSVETSGEQIKSSSCKRVSADLKEDAFVNGNKISVPYRADSLASKSKIGRGIGAMVLKQKVSQKSTCHDQDAVNMLQAQGKEKSLVVRKKSKGSQNIGKRDSKIPENCLTVGVYAVPNRKKTSKMLDLKPQREHRVLGNHRVDLEDIALVQLGAQVDALQKPYGDRDSVKGSDVESTMKERRHFGKSKERPSRRSVDNQMTSGTLPKLAPNDVPPVQVGPASGLEPPMVTPVVIEENWVCCDRCQKWRLLPFGMKPNQLPDKWLCSMLSWLPGMNSCDVSEDETTKALNALYQLPLPENQDLPNHTQRTGFGVTSADVLHVDQKHQNINSSLMPNRGKNKEFPKGAIKSTTEGHYVQFSNIAKNLPHEMVKSRSLNDMNKPLLEPHLMNNSNIQHTSKSCSFSMDKNIKPKAKHESRGDQNRKKSKSKRGADQYGYGATKKIKTADVNASTLQRSKDLDRVGFNSSTEFPSKAADKNIEKHNKGNYPKDPKHDPGNRLQNSVEMKGDSAQVSPRGGSLDGKTYNEGVTSIKKSKIMAWQGSQKFMEALQIKGKLDAEVTHKESIDSEFRKVNKSRVSSIEESSTSKGDDRLNRKRKTTRILLSGGSDKPVHAMEEVRSIDGDQHPRKHRAVAVSKHKSNDVDSLKRDLRSEQFSVAANSSSSKASDSCKTNSNFREVNGSPVESVSSSPMRTFYPHKLTPARGDSVGNAAANCEIPIVGSPRKSMNTEVNIESNQRRIVGKENDSGVFNPEPPEFPELEFRNNDGIYKYGGKTKLNSKPPEFENLDVVNSDADTLEQQSSCPLDLHGSDCYRNEDSMKNHNNDDAPFPQKSVKGSSLQSKGRGKGSGSTSERVKVKVCDPARELEQLNSKNKMQGLGEIGAHNLASCCEEMDDMKRSIKHLKNDNNVDKKAFEKWICDGRIESWSKFREHEGSDKKLGTLSDADVGLSSLPKPVQDLERKITKKMNSIQVDARGRKSLGFPSLAGNKDAMACVEPVSRFQTRNEFDVFPVDDSGDGDVSKVLKQPGSAVNRNAVHHCSELTAPNHSGVKDLCAPSPRGRDASEHVTSNALKEAEFLRDYGDRLKNSGFDFEYKEAYFQAALKFLHVASRLETCNTDNKRGEINLLQLYSNAAKLCEDCAHGYEKREEMAAATLAYKCMEVAYMKVVYCKHFNINRDRHALQASLQMMPQGESPSSSASDIDNLNNPAMMDKATLTKGIASNPGNHVIFARQQPSFVRMLDFTNDVNSAMEASRKYQNTFEAAKDIMERIQNKEGIVSVKRVIDFSFQDVEELIRLVELAIKAIGHRGFSGNKD